MDSSGYLRDLKADQQVAKHEVVIPTGMVEAAVNMSRADRRRLYRLTRKADKRAAKAAARRAGD